MVGTDNATLLNDGTTAGSDNVSTPLKAIKKEQLFMLVKQKAIPRNGSKKRKPVYPQGLACILRTGRIGHVSLP